MSGTCNREVLEAPAYGRPFQLGMLYNAMHDKLIQGQELWNKDTLQKAQQDKPFIDTQFHVIVDDSLGSKCQSLGASCTGLKMNLLAGLVNVSGAALYFSDHKPSRETCRATVHFKCSSRKTNVDVQQLVGLATNQAVIGATRATHFVSAILYGLEAFLVLDRPHYADEDTFAIRKSLSDAAHFLANMYDSGETDTAKIDQIELSKYNFKLYSDVSLTGPFTSFQDFVATLKDQLLGQFRQGSSCTSLVPKAVWLHPLTEIDSSAPVLVQEISDSIFYQAEKITEELIEAEVWIDDIQRSNAQVCSTIQCFQKQQSRVLHCIKSFRNILTKHLSTIIPSIRNGSISSDQLASLLTKVTESPFSSSYLSSLLKGIEQEVRAVSQYLQSLNSVKCVTSDGLDELALESDSILAFEFKLGGSHTASLDQMEEFMRSNFSLNSPVSNSQVTPWYKNGPKKRAMQIKAKRFKEYAMNNSTKNYMTFVVHVNSETPSPSEEGATVVLHGDDEPTEFELPSKPLKVCITKDTGDQVRLAWSKPKHGEANVTAYVINSQPVNEQEHRQVTVSTDGTNESVLLKDLVPSCEYQFTVQAECVAGMGPKSDIVSRKTVCGSPCPKQKPTTSTALVKAQNHQGTQEQPVELAFPSTTSGASVLGHDMHSNLQQSITSTSQATPIVLTLPPSCLPPQMFSLDPVELNLASSTTTPWPLLTEQPPEPTGGASAHIPQTSASYPSQSQHGAQPFSPVVSSHEAHAYDQHFELAHTASFSQQLPESDVTGPSAHFQARHESVNRGAQAVPASAKLASGMPTLEINDPPDTDKAPIPDQSSKMPFGHMDKPEPKNVTYKSIDLEWKRPTFGRNTVQYYSIFYHIESKSEYREKKTGGSEQQITIDGLSCEMGYIFKVQASFSSGIKIESEPTGPIYTKAHLAETVRLKSKLITEKTPKKPAIYELTKSCEMINKQKRMARYSVGQPLGVTKDSEKVLMVVGATGAGKTTLINGIANFMYGVQWEDDFRFILVSNEPAKKSQAHSQTSWITAYTLHKGPGSPIPYSLTIIDTPGFGDTEGVERDKKIADQIKDFFSVRPPDGIDILHGIGFVAQASLARLSPSQQYIFDSILSIYGRDVASNIFMMTTFADGQDPPVMEAIIEAKIPHQTYFKFNNSALYVTGKEDSFDAMFWKMGIKSFVDFFADFGKAEHRSLQLTREVLDEREQLENVLKELQPQIHAGLTKMDELQRVVVLLEHNKSLIEQNKDFIIKVPVTKQRKIDTPRGRYTTNCLNCNYTCHDDCAYANDADKKSCCAMDSWGNCKVCPGNCVWNRHVNNPYIFELYDDVEVRTSAELKDRYDTAKEGESRAETMVANIKDELNTLEIIVLEQVDKARRSLIRLDEIALKPNPLSEVDYIDQLIKSEEQQGKLGWKERVAAYKALRKRASLMRKIKDHKQVVNEPLFSWLGEDGARGSYAPATLSYLKNPKNPVVKKKTWYQFWK